MAAFINLTFILEKQDDGTWTAECVELGTANFGDTFEEALDSIRESVELHLNALEDAGERERFFKKYNIKMHSEPRDSVKVDISTRSDNFVHSEFYPLQAVC